MLRPSLVSLPFINSRTSSDPGSHLYSRLFFPLPATVRACLAFLSRERCPPLLPLSTRLAPNLIVMTLFFFSAFSVFFPRFFFFFFPFRTCSRRSVSCPGRSLWRSFRRQPLPASPSRLTGERRTRSLASTSPWRFATIHCHFTRPSHITICLTDDFLRDLADHDVAMEVSYHDLRDRSLSA